MSVEQQKDQAKKIRNKSKQTKKRVERQISLTCLADNASSHYSLSVRLGFSLRIIQSPNNVAHIDNS